MSVKSKTVLKSDVDTVLADGSDIKAVEHRALEKDEIDSWEDFINSYTTAQIAAIASPVLRQIVYDTDFDIYKYYNGSAWTPLGLVSDAVENTYGGTGAMAAKTSAAQSVVIGKDAGGIVTSDSLITIVGYGSDVTVAGASDLCTILGATASAGLTATAIGATSSAPNENSVALGFGTLTTLDDQFSAGSRFFTLLSHAAPAAIGDSASLYVADITAGNSAFHTKTENGQIVKLYTTNAGSAYAATNVTPDRTYDANATTTDELADVLGTLIADLKLTGLIA